MSLGFEQAGFDVVAALEYDPVHAAVHKFNFPRAAIICADANEVTKEMLREAIVEGLCKHGRKDFEGEVDVVFGGPPCQGFSTIGKRRVDDERNSLVNRFAYFVRSLRPRYFVMENVPGIATGTHSSILAELRGAFGSEYLVLPHSILNAADFGAPQDRRRLILMGHRLDQRPQSYPKPTVRRVQKRSGDTPRTSEVQLELTSHGSALPTGPTVGQAIGDLPDLDMFQTLLNTDEVQLPDEMTAKMAAKASPYARRLRGVDQDPRDLGYGRKWDPTLLTSSLRTTHTDESIRRFKSTECGETEKISRFYKLDPNGLCNTLRAGSGSERGAFTSPRPLHPRIPRVISVREAARLHGFPDWFRLHRTKWHGFRQIGNAVPPPLARALATEIVRALGILPRPGCDISLGDIELLGMNRLQAASKLAVNVDRIPKSRRRNLEKNSAVPSVLG
jgi:DNA (cytosine-5)-methyltransferase 1